MLIKGAFEIETGNELHMFTHPGPNAEEWQYAAGELIDRILDLQVGQGLQFEPVREATGNIGLILRTA